MDTKDLYQLQHRMDGIANKEYLGGCACGAIKFTASGDPKVVAQCHCEECRRTSGTGHSTGAMFRVDDVDISGELSTYIYTASNGNQVTKAFCPICSSPIYGSNSGNPTYLTLTVGCMDDPSAFTPQVVIYSQDRPEWDHIDPDIMSFDKQPDWKPE